MVQDDIALVKIYRYDPAADAAPGYKEYLVPYRQHTVLDVLRYIQEFQDSTLAFRWGCGKGRCRACAVSVNGQPVLACMKLAEKEMTIEPHPKFRVIKDLVVDFEDDKMTPAYRNWSPSAKGGQ